MKLVMLDRYKNSFIVALTYIIFAIDIISFA